MSTNPSVVADLYARVEPLFGRTPDDPEVQALLIALGKWPVKPFGPEEFTNYVSEKSLGYSLLFEDADLVKHPAAQGKPPRAPLLTGCFFFAEGVANYNAFPGALPAGIAWSDTAAVLVSRLGPPKNEIKSKKTGLVSSHRWALDPLLLTVSYRGGGASITEVYVGIT